MTLTVQTRSIRHRDPLAVLRAAQRAFGVGNTFLLESLAGPDPDMRASVVGVVGVFELRVVDRTIQVSGHENVVDAGAAALTRSGLIVGDPQGGFRLADDAALWRIPETLQSVFAPEGVAAANIGILAYYGYEAVRYVEQLPRPPHLPSATEPDAVFSVVHTAITMPHGSVVGYAATTSCDLWEVADLDVLCAELADDEEVVDAPLDVPAPSSVHDDVSAADYARRVLQALEHIRAGDVYQVQLGHELTVVTTASPMQVYRRMRAFNASPYMCFLPIAGSVITGASPELYVRVHRDHAQMRPIAGTARRTRVSDVDARAVTELRTSEKECAEHVMLVDLCRNDLGRIAATDSTRTEGLMTVEQYSHVFHLVTSVDARIDAAFTISDVIRAGFPAGTMTGAPKVRAMEVIDELETSPRGYYAGAFGVIDFNGDAVLGLAIRMVVHRDGKARIRASAGVVADSTPEGEWDETKAKMSAAYFAVTGEELQ